jgi:hypothetical protein
MFRNENPILLNKYAFTLILFVLIFFSLVFKDTRDLYLTLNN